MNQDYKHFTLCFVILQYSHQATLQTSCNVKHRTLHFLLTLSTTQELAAQLNPLIIKYEHLQTFTFTEGKVKVQAPKAQRGSKGLALLFL